MVNAAMEIGCSIKTWKGVYMDESSRLQEIKSRLEAKVHKLERQYAEAKRQYDSVVTSLELLADNPSKRSQATGIGVEVSEIAGKKLKEALLYIAEKGDGLLKVTPVRKILVEAEVLKNGQSGSNRISSTLIDMPEFERLSRGQYRLRGESEGTKKSNSRPPTSLKVVGVEEEEIELDLQRTQELYEEREEESFLEMEMRKLGLN